MRPTPWDRATERIDEVLTDRRKRKLRWGLAYPLVTVAPLWGIAAFDPVLSGVLLVVVTVPAGFFFGLFGEDRRAENVASQWRSPGDGGLPTVGSDAAGVTTGKLITYTSGVTFLGLAGLVGLAKLAFGL